MKHPANPKHLLSDPVDFPNELPLGASKHYLLDRDARLAIRMAWATGRPLLVVGEAGCGKTQLAAALAAQWQVPLLSQTLHARTEAQDLFFHFDAVARLADAQMRSALGTTAGTQPARDPLNPSHYLRPGPLWWALNAETALGLNAGRPPQYEVQPPHGTDREFTAANVVLLDEIDKGSDELVESLLEVLDAGSFSIPVTGQRVERAADAQPFILLTSNGARDLPAPFLRRCIVLAMTLPEADLVPWLSKRGRAHYTAAQVEEEALSRAAELIAQDRQLASKTPRYKPGVAEYLYLCEAVSVLLPLGTEEAQRELVESLAPSVTHHKGMANRLD